MPRYNIPSVGMYSVADTAGMNREQETKKHEIYVAAFLWIVVYM